MARLRVNDQVMVITGKDRGRIGRITKVLGEKDRVIVEKVNLVKRHTKPTQKNPQGGIVEKEASIHSSNVMLLDPKTKQATRISYKTSGDGTKLRVSKKSGEVISALAKV